MTTNDAHDQCSLPYQCSPGHECPDGRVCQDFADCNACLAGNVSLGNQPCAGCTDQGKAANVDQTICDMQFTRAGISVRTIRLIGNRGSFVQASLVESARHLWLIGLPAGSAVATPSRLSVRSGGIDETAASVLIEAC